MGAGWRSLRSLVRDDVVFSRGARICLYATFPMRRGELQSSRIKIIIPREAWNEWLVRHLGPCTAAGKRRSVERTKMPRYFFHQHLNGTVAKDQRGVQLANSREACELAVQRIPAVLGRNLRSTCNTHLATEVSDGKRTLLVVRGKVLIEKR
jgi:hypothetical protein